MCMKTIGLILLFAALPWISSGQGRQITNPEREEGIASYYHDKFIGRPTSTGELFDNDRFTAASNTLHLGSYVKVTNLSNRRSIYVRINDRMHKDNKRVIDLTRLAAEELGFLRQGITKVKVERVPESEAGPAILSQRERIEASRTNRL